MFSQQNLAFTLYVHSQIFKTVPCQTFSLHPSMNSMLDAGSKQFPEILHETYIGSVEVQSLPSLPEESPDAPLAFLWPGTEFCS